MFDWAGNMLEVDDIIVMSSPNRSPGLCQGTVIGFKGNYVEVQLSGLNGNAFSVMAEVANALRKAGVSKEEIAQYREESMSGDYDNLLQTAMKWVDVS